MKKIYEWTENNTKKQDKSEWIKQKHTDCYRLESELKLKESAR